MKIRLLALALCLGSAGSAVSAQTPAIDQARAAGQVGERFDGYLGLTNASAGMLRSQVAAINIRRRALYNNLAVSRKVTTHDVGITAGCSLLARVQVGEAYLLPDGVWRRRAAGQAAPLPDYCR
jgi:uncharacterized protein YdbL (DUF1318 family)